MYMCGKNGVRIITGIVRHGLPLSAVLLILSACSSGGDSDTTGDTGNTGNTGNTNRSPIVIAGSSQAVLENTTVNLSGSASDPDQGDTLTYAWTQLSGQVVVINNADAASASFTAPDVAAGIPEALMFRLTVTDNGGLSTSGQVTITVSEPQANVTISGTLSYEFPPPNTAPVCDGLNFSAIETRPIRGATVQIIDAVTDAVLGSATASDIGGYSITVPGQTQVFVRVRAELKRVGAPSWDVEVRNNVVSAGDPNPPVRGARPLYVLDGADFDSGFADSSRNLTATTGWNIPSANYNGVRAAAPFSVLDTIFTAMQLVIGEEPQATFPPLDAFWSVGNNTAQGTGTLSESIDAGELGTSFFIDFQGNELFLLGMEGDDAEEFDDHVIVHEWGHYFESSFSRSDSIGGAHGPDDRLDPRVAFGEGFATALSGIALGDPNYCDTLWFQGDLRGFRINIEGGSSVSAGWWDEFSIIRLVYDLWDTVDDATDTGSIGFGPIYEVMVGDQAVTGAFTSIFSFAESLRSQNPGELAFIDAQLTAEGITAAGVDRWASTETSVPSGPNDPPAPLDVLPVYTTIVPDGSVTEICSNRQYEGVGVFGSTGNKLGEHRFVRMNIAVQRPYTFSIITTTDVTPEASDPDMHFFLNGQFQNQFIGNDLQGRSGDVNQEIFTTPNSLTPGEYVIDVWEWRYQDSTRPDTYPDRVCFDVSVTPS